MLLQYVYAREHRRNGREGEQPIKYEVVGKLSWEDPAGCFSRQRVASRRRRRRLKITREFHCSRLVLSPLHSFLFSPPFFLFSFFFFSFFFFFFCLARSPQADIVKEKGFFAVAFPRTTRRPRRECRDGVSLVPLSVFSLLRRLGQGWRGGRRESHHPIFHRAASVPTPGITSLTRSNVIRGTAPRRLRKDIVSTFPRDTVSQRNTLLPF